MRTKRSFWLLVAVAVVVEVVAFALAWRSTSSQLPCRVHWLWRFGSRTGYGCFFNGTARTLRPLLPVLIVCAVPALTIALALYEVLRQFILLARLRRYLRPACEPSAGLRAMATNSGVGRLRVVEEAVGPSSPICEGLLHPTVVVSRSLLDILGRPELEAMLSHEGAHQRRRDPLRFFIASVATRALFFTPILADLRTGTRLASELHADAVATEAHGRRQLVSALRAVLNAVTPMRDEPAVVAQMVSSTMLTERLQALGGSEPKVAVHRVKVVVSGVALVALLTLSLTIPAPNSGPKPLTVVPVPSYKRK